MAVRAKAVAPAVRATVRPAPESEAAPRPQAYASETIAREIARPVMPTVPGRVVATNRAGMPIQRTASGAGVNRFFIPPHLPPPGWSWEFKRETVTGMTDPAYMAELMKNGWEPVMYESYPGIFAPEFDDKGLPIKGPVRIDGQMLMERAEVLTLEARAEEKRKADDRVGTASRQYSRLDTSGTATAEFDMTAQRASYIRKGAPEPLPPMNPAARQPID